MLKQLKQYQKNRDMEQEIVRSFQHSLQDEEEKINI